MKKQNEDMTSDELARIDDLDITPLSDEELDSVAGGYTDETTAESCACCVSGATEIIKPTLS